MHVNFDCPFEGAIDPEAVIKILDTVFEIGVDGVTLADTIGTADPSKINNTLSREAPTSFLIRIDNTY
ncbi:MAG: hypothetical protein VB083_02275 [Aminobacterium sp.]|uniref:hypothetical protein n=1 Tax=Aminobacterium sp. TaxID=1872491 RepID=UPI002B20E81E|nr:hypothetical protein [Aminobacterium sp.]MEA4876714.1 hypothetical protein [Aminobacterium sp.]